MKIGVMLRSIGDRQGIGIYTRNLMDELIPIDRTNEYVLFYPDASYLGRFSRYGNVTEQAIPASNKAVWDQVLIPRAARRHGVDLIFHTKFTVPLFTRCRTAMTVHGASWFVHPELYKPHQIAYIKAVMPFYCRRADIIFSNSELTRQDFIRLRGVDSKKIHTTPLGTNPDFHVIADRDALDRARRKYELPDEFVLSVIRYDPRKNFGNLIAAFRLLRQRMRCKLVIAGLGCERYLADYSLDSDGTAGDTRFLGWVDQKELPLLYNLATCMFFPSVYEEFGIPTCEAMACGCPVVVSKTGALPEIAGDAGLLVDPFNPEEMADALQKMLTDSALRRTLSEKGLARAAEFTWARCALETLRILNEP